MKSISYKTITGFLVIIFTLLTSQQLSLSVPLDVYKVGVKFYVSIKLWGFSTNGTMEVLRHDNVRGENVVLIKSQIKEIRGLIGFLVKFLRVYKEANSFDSYIDPKTGLSVRYEVYKLKKDGTKKPNEHIFFDRKLRRIVSYESNSTTLSNVSPDIQDTFAGFLDLICIFNAENIFIGKLYSLNLYLYKEEHKVNIRVVSQKIVDGHKIYTLKIERLPDVFKYPASGTFEVAENGGLMLPTKGTCTIDLPIKDINVNCELTLLNKN